MTPTRTAIYFGQDELGALRRETTVEMADSSLGCSQKEVAVCRETNREVTGAVGLRHARIFAGPIHRNSLKEGLTEGSRDFLSAAISGHGL
jgi:hypothetical protein